MGSVEVGTHTGELLILPSDPRAAFSSLTVASVGVEGQKRLVLRAGRSAAHLGPPLGLKERVRGAGRALPSISLGRGWREEEEEIKWGCLELRPASHHPNLRPRGHLLLCNWPPTGLPCLLSDPRRPAAGKLWRGGGSFAPPGVGAREGEGEGKGGRERERPIKRGTRREASESRGCQTPTRSRTRIFLGT